MPITRRTLLQGGLAALIATTGCGPMMERTLRLFVEKPGFLITDHLIVREGYTHAVTYTSRKKGESELVELANDSKIEESWLFFETEEEQGTWIDVGSYQTPYVSRHIPEFLTKEIKYMQSVRKRRHKPMTITPYHIHTLYSVCNQKNKYGLGQYLKQLFGKENELPQVMLEISTMPSDGDIINYAVLEDSFKGMLTHSKMHLRSPKVGAPTGVFEYNFTDKFKRSYLHGNNYSGVENLFIAAVQEGFQKQDLNASLEVLRSAGIDITFNRVKTFDKPLLLTESFK